LVTGPEKKREEKGEGNDGRGGLIRRFLPVFTRSFGLGRKTRNTSLDETG